MRYCQLSSLLVLKQECSRKIGQYHSCCCPGSLHCQAIARGPSQYQKRRLSVRSRKVSKPRDLYIELSDRSEIWQALRQQCCRCACQISKRYDNLKYQSRGFETLRVLTKRRLFGYWDGAQVPCVTRQSATTILTIQENVSIRKD